MANGEQMPKKVFEASINDPEKHRAYSRAGGLATAEAKRKEAEWKETILILNAERDAREREFDRQQARDDVLPPEKY